ncbi:hypothetical protein ACFX2I_014087 [Malus domestica]
MAKSRQHFSSQDSSLSPTSVRSQEWEGPSRWTEYLGPETTSLMNLRSSRNSGLDGQVHSSGGYNHVGSSSVDRSLSHREMRVQNVVLDNESRAKSGRAIKKRMKLRNPVQAYPTLLAFKPGQVLFAIGDMEHRKPNSSADGAQTLSPDQKGPPLRAVARFLENNGFSKTLKKFLSEAGIKKGELKDLPLDLGRMYCKYSEMLCCSNSGPSKIANWSV